MLGGMNSSETPPLDCGDRRRGLQLLLGIALFLVAQLVMAAVAGLIGGPASTLIGALVGAAPPSAATS